MDIRFDEAGPDDTDTIADLAVTTWNESYRSVTPQSQIDYMLDNLQSSQAVRNDMSNGYRYFIVQCDGEPMGYAAVLPEEDSMFLSKIYVLDGYKGKGVAGTIMNFIRGLADGKQYIHLTVNRRNYIAIAFYEKNGFIITGQKKKDIGGGFFMDDHLMRLYLK